MKTQRISKVTSLLIAVGIAASVSTSAFASITFTGSDASQQLSASATFTYLGGGNLQVTLANTYTGDTVDQGHVLTGVFFNDSGAGGLAPVSATAGAGSVQWSGTVSSAAPSSTVLGTEWAYGTGSAPHGANAGIISSGYYNPGTGNFGPGNPVGTYDMLDGSAYGILSVGYAGSDLDGLGTRIYIQPSMVFVLSGFDGKLNGLTDVSFQYGTALNEPNVVGNILPSVPEAPTVIAGVLLLLPLGASTIRILRKNRAA
jgi:hypothetical protein